MIQCMYENLLIKKYLQTMKTAKITEIWKAKKWEWPHGDVYYIPLTLDNGEKIQLGKKSETAFKVWDTISYEVVEEGKKWKEVKENPFKPRSYNSDNNVGAMIGMAMKIAFEHLYDKTNYNETFQLATRIFEDSMWLLESYGKKPENKLEEDNEDQNLPF